MKVDYIVIGLGAVGSAALYHLSKLGVDVIGIEQFNILHNFGSTHGETRAIRRAYFENPQYVPILDRAYNLWESLEHEVGKELFIKSGILEVGLEDNEILVNAESTADKYNISVNKLSRDALIEKYPAITFRENVVGLLEENAGYLRVNDCIHSQLDVAKEHGAEVHENEKLISYKALPSGSIEVRTDKETYQCKKLLLCCGAWSKRLLSNENLNLSVLIKGLYWHKVNSEAVATYKDMPTFFFSLLEGDFYGFPEIDGRIKFARHSGGIDIDSPLLKKYHDIEEKNSLSYFIAEHFPLVSSTCSQSETCYYTCSNDNDFIVDFNTSEDIVFIAGLSGHGFKMSNALGEIAANMATTGRRSEEALFLGKSRFENRKK